MDFMASHVMNGFRVSGLRSRLSVYHQNHGAFVPPVVGVLQPWNGTATHPTYPGGEILNLKNLTTEILKSL